MRLKRHIITASLAVGALALTGCTPGGSGDGEITSLSIMAPYFSATAPEADDPINAALNELTGVDVDMRWSPNAEYNAQTNVVLAGDDIPDVMVIQQKTQGFIQTAEAGGFWDLTPYIESGDYPNLVSADAQVQEASGVNGKVYGVYRARDLVRYVVILRKDWLQKLGLEIPTTTEELRDVAQAFSENDPDGNGVDDTYGLIDVVWSGVGVNNPLDAVDAWYGAGNVWTEKDGELVPSWDTPEWLESLNYQRDMFESGIINPDFPTKDGATNFQAFLNGEGGMMFAVSSNAADILNLARQADPETADDLVAIAPQPSGPNGEFALPTAGYSGFLAIPKSKVQTEEQLDQVLSVLNEMSSTEGQKLLGNGIEGDNYTEEDGYAVYDDAASEQTTLVTQAWYQLVTGTNGLEVLRSKPKTEAEAALEADRVTFAEQNLEHAVFNPAAGIVSPTYLTGSAQLDQIISDARMQYIAGEIDESALLAAIENWRSSGGDKVITEYNDLYSSSK